ncbi:hypothetical protein [Streptomyces ureilyticus]|uniref:Uncharacterized protein n=1 Tax=Streptomyces ureilyticus TaxID=1775131 RepID=A0ABX0E395_9ACTN|nr:hypothetical protein [Streptomyces ureilyticus]NGO47304.1 hypothetical protein [Streptomyces ureilyticus]
MRKIASRIAVLACSTMAVTGVADIAPELTSLQVTPTIKASERDLGWGVKAFRTESLPRLGR